MNNYYQPPNLNQNPNPYQYQYNYDEAAKKKAYYIEKAAKEKKELRHLGNIFGLTMTVYVFVQILSSSLLALFGWVDLYQSSALFMTCFTIVFIDLIGIVGAFGIMAFINRKKYTTELIPTKKLPFKELSLWVGFGMFCCIIANYIVNIMVYFLQAMGHDPYQNETPEPTSVLTSIAIAVGTAVMPALCEEFAMRCCGLGLVRKYGKGFAVISVSLIFGLLHGNLVQFVFATVVGLILGYVTVKTGSVIPAVLIHLFNNGISVITSILEYAVKIDSTDTIAFWFAVWFVFGLISLLVLGVKGCFRRESEVAYEPYQNSLGKKLAVFFFVPGMIIPFLFFITMIVASIK